MTAADNKKVEVIKSILESLEDSDLLNLYENTYVESNMDEAIYLNEKWWFNELMGEGRSPWEIACDLQGTGYNVNDKYFRFDGQGNIESFNRLSDHIDFDEVARYIVRNCKESQINEDWIDEDEVVDAVVEYSESKGTPVTGDEIDDYVYNYVDILTYELDDLIEGIIREREED